MGAEDVLRKLDPEAAEIIRGVLRTLLRGNSDLLATEADWPRGARCCQGRSPEGAKCAIEVPHNNTPHRFCRRQYTRLTGKERERYHKRRDEQEPRMRELVTNLNAAAPEIRELWKLCSSHWTYEDPIYRLWHGSFKVYSLQGYTLQIVAALQALLPKRQLNADFLDLIAEGTGKVFHRDVNKKWFASTRVIVDIYFHARFMLEMAAKYAKKFKTPPRSLPSGWAAFLYLYDLR